MKNLSWPIHQRNIVSQISVQFRYVWLRIIENVMDNFLPVLLNEFPGHLTGRLVNKFDF